MRTLLLFLAVVTGSDLRASDKPLPLALQPVVEAAVSENRIMELRSDGTSGPQIRVPLKQPFQDCFTAAVRAGCPPSAILDVLGHRSGAANIVSYAQDQAASFGRGRHREGLRRPLPCRHGPHRSADRPGQPAGPPAGGWHSTASVHQRPALGSARDRRHQWPGGIPSAVAHRRPGTDSGADAALARPAGRLVDLGRRAAGTSNRLVAAQFTLPKSAAGELWVAAGDRTELDPAAVPDGEVTLRLVAKGARDALPAVVDRGLAPTGEARAGDAGSAVHAAADAALTSCDDIPPAEDTSPPSTRSRR